MQKIYRMQILNKNNALIAYYWRRVIGYLLPWVTSLFTKVTYAEPGFRSVSVLRLPAVAESKAIGFILMICDRHPVDCLSGGGCHLSFVSFGNISMLPTGGFSLPWVTVNAG